MSSRVITEKRIALFGRYLSDNEKSLVTIEKYLRDIRHFREWLGERACHKKEVIAYKESLSREYAVTSANSMLAALNAFFRFVGWQAS